MEADDWHVSGLTVGQVADRMRIAPSAVRWYDDHGLLPSERTAGNQRRFFADVLCRVAMIRASRRVGLSIEEIREALSALPPRQVPTPEDWERLAGHLRYVASQRIGELFAILEELSPAPGHRADMTDERRGVMESIEPDPELQLSFTPRDRRVTDAEIDQIRELARSGTVEAASRRSCAVNRHGPCGRGSLPTTSSAPCSIG